MASVVLGRAVLALFADPATAVVIPSLMAAPYTLGRDRTSVRFAGDEYPTGFRGEGRSRTYTLTCRYPRARYDELLALLHLVDVLAPASPDPRMFLRTHFGLAVGLDVAVAVEPTGPLQVTPGAAVTDVTFPVEVVQHSFAV